MKASLIKQSEVHIQVTEQLTMTFGQNLLPFNIVKELLVILVLAQQYYQYITVTEKTRKWLMPPPSATAYLTVTERPENGSCYRHLPRETTR